MPRIQTKHAGWVAAAARVYNSGALETVHNTAFTVTFDSESFDPDGLHNTGSNTERITIAVPGKYLVGVCIEWASNAVGYRYIEIRQGASTVVASSIVAPSATSVTRQEVITLVTLAAGDYVWAKCSQTSTGNLNIDADGIISPTLWVAFVGQ